MREISRSEALDQGLDRFFTGKPCKRGHVSERYVKSLMCVQCARERPYRQAQTGLRRAVWEKGHGHCWYCGTQLPEDKRRYQIDHVIPPVHGGTDDFSNLVPSCGRCNNAKNSRTLEQFRCVRARQAAGMPSFTKEQIAYLEALGFEFPPLPEYKFWFEERGLN